MSECVRLMVQACVVFSPTARLVVLGSLSSQWREIGNASEIHLFQTSSVLEGEESPQGVPGDLFG